MIVLLWGLQAAAAIMYAASAVMKIFMFDRISEDVRSFDALPRQAWLCFGVLELVCVAGLILPSVSRWHPILTVAAATLLALESPVFIWVHVRYHETTPIVASAVLGLLMLFVAYGRFHLHPLS